MSCTKRFLSWGLPALVFFAASALASGVVQAGIAITGDVDPSDSSSWTTDTIGSIGKDSAGTVTVDSGSTFQSEIAYIGNESTASGTVSIADSSTWNNLDCIYVGNLGTGLLDIQNGDVSSNALHIGVGYYTAHTASGTVMLTGPGATCNVQRLVVGLNAKGSINIENGATWTTTNWFDIGYGYFSKGTVTVDDATLNCNGESLQIGYYGDGWLNINNGAIVSAESATVKLGEQAGSSGAIAFGGTGGTLTVKQLYASPSQLTGTGTIETRGLVSDVNLSFDSTHGLRQTLTDFGDVAVTLDMSDSSDPQTLGIGHNGTGTLTISGSTLTTGKAILGNRFTASGTATVAGSNSVWTCRGIEVGSAGTGTLKISNGGTVNNSHGTHIGGFETGDGVVEVNGDGSTLNTNDLLVGALGLGQLYIRNGGAVISNSNVHVGDEEGALGVVTVEGDDSTFDINGHLWIGKKGDADMYINDGVSVTTGQDTAVGLAQGFLGTLNFDGGTLTTQSLYATPSNSYSQVTGTGTINTHGLVSDKTITIDSTGIKTFTFNDQVTVNLDTSDTDNLGDLGAGYWGNASLTIENGAVANSAIGFMGYKQGASGTITVTGSGSTWNNTGELVVYNGKLEITSGGVVHNDTSHIGFMQMMASCVATVSGTGSIWSNGELNIGGLMGQGVVDIANGGTVIATGITCGFAMSTATINLDGGILKASADNSDWIAVEPSSTANVFVKEGGATFNTDGHDIGIALPLQHGGSNPIDGGVTKTGTGTLILSGANNYTGLTIVEAGTLELGASAQSRVFSGAGADIQGGKLVFDHTGGTATGGQIWDILDDGFGTDVTSGQIYSSTAQTNGMALGWADDGSQVTVMYTLYGDSNLDGSVNGTDLNAVLSYYNQSTDPVWGSQIWEHGDFNYDGSVNGTDLNSVLSNYNQSLPSSTAAVPEPSTLLLMVLGLVGLLAWRKRFGIC